MEPETGFARTTDGVSISWSSVGEGPVLIHMPGVPFSNRAAEWRIAVLREAFVGLARNLRLIQYDGRGTGHSQRDIDDRSLDAMLRDLEAVIEAAGVRRYALLGFYASVPFAIAAAARRPDDASHLILFGGSASGQTPMSGSATQALLSLIERDWDTFVESATHAWLGWPDPEQGRLSADWFRTATTPANARATLEAASAIDVTADCARVRCPVLVLHRTTGPPVTLEMSAELTASLPNARLEILPGTSASLFYEHTGELVELITDFVLGSGMPLPASASPARAPAGLTAREVEVLRLVASGESNAEIARRLDVTVNTVERHVANVYRKIDARGRADATAFAIRNGLA
jgi:DNA-binding CsgD family transcriptional regulator/pimeloyl-ACP methyl ester carboxylesterase